MKTGQQLISYDFPYCSKKKQSELFSITPYSKLFWTLIYTHLYFVVFDGCTQVKSLVSVKWFQIHSLDLLQDGVFSITVNFPLLSIIPI